MEEENEYEYKRAKDRSPSPGIKSTAVVKYTAFPSPVSYARLQCNTDLNLPPSNWGAAIDSYGLKQILTGSTPLSSFRMAHMFPDCVGAVDVISGAECIKKLLKLPYQPNGTVSMMVHRVENTLLLDDFDVYDYLMKSEWGWLKDFFYENILKTMSEKERMSLTPPPTHNALQLTHKFLSHSVCVPEAKGPTPGPSPGPYLPEPERSEPPNEHLYDRNVLWTFEDIQMLIGSDLPIFGDKDRPCVSLRLRDAREPINVLTGIDYWLDNLMCNVPEVLMCYHLDGIVQKYEPMKTEDLPNMENSKFSPKVVRNVAQNILSFLKYNATKAGHTYWLFKGPHDDVVKLYDLTSLCPDSLDNPFTTPVAMLLYRVARNMRLTNRSRHVRQLLEQAINLLKVERYPQIVASSHYMLADLYVPATTNPACPDFKDESSDSESEDPDFEPTEVTSERDVDSVKDETETFNDIDDSGDKNENDSGDKNKSGDSENGRDAKISDDKVGDGKVSDGKDGKSECGDGDGEKEEKSLALQMRGLALRDIGDKMKKEEDNKRKGHEAKGLGVEPPDRCGHALRHALKGLLALHNVTIDKCKEEERERLKEQILIEEQHPKMANPYEPISMNYEPIKQINKDKEHNSRSRRRKREKKISKSEYLIEANSNIDKNAILVRKEQKKLPTYSETNRDDNFAWKLHLKTLLYEKICLAYATLAEYSYAHEQYGFSLKYIELASKCQKLLSNMIIKSKVVDSSCLIGRMGDNFFQLSKNWHRLEQFKKQFETDHDIDSKIKLEIENDLVEEVEGVLTNEFDLDISLPNSELSSMLACCSYYRLALAATSDKRAELQRRLASVTNELAVRYMNDAQQIYAKYNEEEPQDPKAQLLLKQFNTLSKRSLECLDEASTIFEEVNDVPNLALLYCNKGRYLRFKAHCDQGSFDERKRKLYNTAEELYLTALKLVGRGDTGGVRELVQWELSCHLYTRAVLMQDCPGSRPNEVSEVAEAFNHALKYCQLTPGPRQYLYQFRAAMIHHRLGSLYHSQYRITSEEGPKRRALLNSARTNYMSCTHMFAALEDASMFLTARLEHVALCECSAAVSPNLKLKSLQTAIELLRQSHSIMKLLKHRDPEDLKDAPKSEDQDERSMKNEHSLLSLFENRLHYILKSIIQYCRSKSNKDYEKMTDMYKRLYSASLKIKKDDDLRIYAGSICDVLEAMDDISKEFE